MKVVDPEVKPRTREVWTKDERKRIERGVRGFVEKRIAVTLHCQLCGTELQREKTADGFDFLCDCRRIVIVRGI